MPSPHEAELPPDQTVNVLEWYKIAFEEGKRCVSDQIAELDSMRQRTSAFLAFVGSATAFLVGTALKDDSRTGTFFGIAALATLISAIFIYTGLLVLLSTLPIWRKLSWGRPLSPGAVAAYVSQEKPPQLQSDLYLAIVREYDEMVVLNDGNLTSLRPVYASHLVLGFIQLFTWGVLAWMQG